MTGIVEPIVVGHDGSKAADTALAWAENVFGPAGDLIVVHVVRRSDDGHRLGIEGAVSDRLLDQVRDWIAQAGIQRDLKASVVEGRAAHGLHRFAERVDARAIVIGGHPSDDSAPWWGSTANELAHLGRVPLVMVPEGWKRPLKQAVVGDDGSDQAVGAMAWLAPLLTPPGVGVHGVRAVTRVGEWVPRHDPSSWIHQARSELATRLGDTLGSRSTTTAEVVCDTHPVSAILQAADDVDADLVVVGARGAGGFPALRIGGVAVALLHHATRPLAIVPS